LALAEPVRLVQEQEHLVPELVPDQGWVLALDLVPAAALLYRDLPVGLDLLGA
jgi:hypothetical protein